MLASSEQMNVMVKRFAGLVLFAFLLGLVASCGTLGNGKVDLPAYDVALALVLPSGEHIELATDGNGVRVAGKYVSPRTGITYEVDPEGTITATDALGNQVRLTPKG